MMAARARVAISIPQANPQVTNNGQYGVHVGHARTLYLGKLIADEVGVPYHVRIDGNRKAFGDDLSLFMEDVVACLKFLRICPERIYWAPQWEDVGDNQLQGVFGSMLTDVLNVFRYYPFSVLTVYDDIINSPSYIIRGMEFSEPMRYNGRQEQVDRMQAFVRFEQALFQETSATIRNIAVPLITVGGKKLAKSEGRFIHWSVLETLPPELVPLFLKNTATNPDEPLSKQPDFKISAISTQPWEWDWSVFRNFCLGEVDND